jgi:hypothetical protein
MLRPLADINDGISANEIANTRIRRPFKELPTTLVSELIVIL